MCGGLVPRSANKIGNKINTLQTHRHFVHTLFSRAISWETPMNTPFREIEIDQCDEEVLNNEDLYQVNSRDPGQVLEEPRKDRLCIGKMCIKFSACIIPDSQIHRGSIEGTTPPRRARPSSKTHFTDST